ncbi:MAG: DUF2975 domain-containing protein [Pseudomonadota bacterium]
MKKQARAIRVLLIVCLLLQVLFYVLAWSALLPTDLFMQMGATDLDAAALRRLTPTQSVAGAAIGLPPLLALVYGLCRLHGALVHVERRLVFDLVTISHIRAFAGAMLGSTMLSILEVPLRALVMRYFALPGVKLHIGVTSDQLLLILVCGMFYLIASMMHEGRRLAEENKEFV